MCTGSERGGKTPATNEPVQLGPVHIVTRFFTWTYIHVFSGTVRTMDLQILLTSCAMAPFCTLYFILDFIVPSGKFRSPYQGQRHSRAATTAVLLIPTSVCSIFMDLCICRSMVFLCVQTVVWLPVSGIFNLHTYVNVMQLHTGSVRTP